MNGLGDAWDKASAIVWGSAIAAPIAFQAVHTVIHGLSMAILGYPVLGV